MESRFWRSVVRHGFPSSNRNRSLAVFSNFFLHFHPVKVRVRAIALTRTFYLGGLTAACFFLLTVTGVFLMLYYHPAVPRAYEDMKDLQFVVSSGMFLRNLHRWSSRVIVILVFLHMAWTFLRGAYRPPREFNWIIGVGLLVVTVLLAFTGDLLPWDQFSYWAVTVGTNVVGAIPVVGEKAKLLLLGGHSVDDAALLRFYVLHCVVLPMTLAMGVGLHVWRVRKDGGIHLPPLADDAQSAASDDSERDSELAPGASAGVHVVVTQDVEPGVAADLIDEPMLMTFPHLLVRELVALLGLSIVLVVMSLLFDAPLAGVADPSRTPNPAKAPWYFLGVQELLQYYPPVVAGILLPMLLVVALAVIPYFRVNVERPPLWESAPLRRLATLWLTIAAMTLFFWFTPSSPLWSIIASLWLVGVAMTAGALSRGEGTFRAWLRTRSLPSWIFVWFLLTAVTLTAIGIWFRGPAWAFTLPWRDGVF